MNGAHLDRGRDPGHDVVMLERVLQGERVDHGREHAHVVGGRAVHALGAGREAAEQIAAADDHRRLHPELLDFADVGRDPVRHRGIDAELLLAHERFAGKFEEDATIDRLRHGGEL